MSDTETSPGELSGKKCTENPTGPVPLSRLGLPLLGAHVSGVIFRRPGERMYGTLTLILSYSDRQDMIDYYAGDISETGRSVICDCLDRIAGQLFTESGTISSTIPYRAPESPAGQSDPEKPESNTGGASATQMKFAWEIARQESNVSLSTQGTKNTGTESSVLTGK